MKGGGSSSRVGVKAARFIFTSPPPEATGFHSTQKVSGTAEGFRNRAKGGVTEGDGGGLRKKAQSASRLILEKCSDAFATSGALLLFRQGLRKIACEGNAPAEAAL